MYLSSLGSGREQSRKTLCRKLLRKKGPELEAILLILEKSKVNSGQGLLTVFIFTWGSSREDFIPCMNAYFRENVRNKHFIPREE